MNIFLKIISVSAVSCSLLFAGSTIVKDVSDSIVFGVNQVSTQVDVVQKGLNKALVNLDNMKKHTKLKTKQKRYVRWTRAEVEKAEKNIAALDSLLGTVPAHLSELSQVSLYIDSLETVAASFADTQKSLEAKIDSVAALHSEGLVEQEYYKWWCYSSTVLAVGFVLLMLISLIKTVIRLFRFGSKGSAVGANSASTYSPKPKSLRNRYDTIQQIRKSSSTKLY